MNVGSKVRWLAACATVVSLVHSIACVTDSQTVLTGSEPTVTQTEQALEESPDEESTHEVRGVPAVVVHWVVPAKSTDHPAQERLVLRAENTSAFVIDIDPQVEMLGLRRLRAEEVGTTMALGPGEWKDFTWSPENSALKPVGSSLELTGRVKYRIEVPQPDGTSETVSGLSSSEHLFLAYSSDYRRVFVSADDDLQVRLSSLATTPSAARVADSESVATRLAAVLDASEHPMGLVDRVDFSSAKETAGEAHSDSLRLTGEWQEAYGDAARLRLGTSGDIEAQPAAAAAMLPNCAAFNGYLSFRNLCTEWRTSNMFNDSAVSSSIPMEDQLVTNSRAHYVLAEVYSGGVVTWAHHLDWAGCTGEAVPVCLGQPGNIIATVKLYPNSIWRESGGDGQSVVLGIYPPVSYVANVYAQAAPNFGYLRVQSQDRWTRAAAVASLALTRTDAAMLNANFAISLDVSKGWANPMVDPNNYAEPGEQPFGEANASLNSTLDPLYGRETFYVRLGRSALDRGPSVAQRYEALAQHTTQSKYTIAHELGHAVQRLNVSGPKTDGYADRPDAGACSCVFVTSGNREHCMGSRHLYSTSNVEGFGHFFAARVTNEAAPGADCRFTYYKTNLLGTGTLNGNPAYFSMAPPAPINCAAPYQGTSTTSWMRSWCPSPTTHLTERDWLTFLWAVNGAASGAQKSSMAKLMKIFAYVDGDPTSFKWSTVDTRSLTELTISQKTKFSIEATNHGLN